MNASHHHHYGLRGYIVITLSLAGIFFLLIYLNQAVLEDNGLLNLAWYAYATLFPAILIGLLGSTAWEYIRQNKAQQPLRPEAAQAEIRLSQSAPILSDLGDRLHRRYGMFWWYKVRILLLVGEPEQVEAIAPGLTTQHWLEGHRTLLLWGGSLHTEPDAAQLAALRRLRRFRPLNGIVWALTEQQSAQPVWMDKALRMLQKQAQQLHWQAPVYLWQVCHSLWSQAGRVTQAVGCFLPERCTPEMVETQLRQLIDPMRQQGMQQVLAENAHDFLYRLASTLEKTGIAHWRKVLTPWLAEYAQVVSLRGLMFSLPLAATPDAGPQSWLPDAAWQGVLADSRHRHGRRVGWRQKRNVYHGLMALALLWGAGSVLSFLTNRDQIAAVNAAVTDLQARPEASDAQLMAFKALRNELGRLQYRVEHGAPWYQRFGLSQNQPLLTAVLPYYTQMNNRLIRDKAAAILHQKLSALVNLPPGSPQRARRAKSAHDQLKAYLMMASPPRAEAAFLTRVLRENEPARAGIAPGVWLSAAPDLWAFYAENLPAHPEWRIQPDTALVSQARRILLEQMGRHNAEATLYQQMLRSVAPDYADLTLRQMTGDTEAERLFTTSRVVPGMFTRQAWEGQIQKAIDNAVASRKEAIDWVLSDNRQAVPAAVSPAALKARLTARYFTDFAGAWQDFLNSLRWNKARNLAGVTDQLTLMADGRQSPLIALMNTVAYQGQTGRQGPALSEVWVKSAKTLLNKTAVPVINQQAGDVNGPMDSTFGPLLALMGKNKASDVITADSNLNLQTFLTRVTQVRLKLQQINTSDDPSERAGRLAQTVFQGKSTDLTETQGYGNLLAAGLGDQWRGFGQTMFVQPLNQAWQGILKPAAASLNEQWQTAIVANWNTAFAGRYPFAGGQSDISLPMLGQFIRPDTGRIEQFLTRQLGGVLHKAGNRWVPDNVNGQGLQVNPRFLQAVNQLSQLSDVLFADGSQGLRFELRARAARDVVETDLTIDGQKLRYFNQMESWQRFRWPGETYKPGVMLTWTSVNAGARLFGDYPGTWGLIRWLARAKAEKWDESRYRLTFTMPDGLPVTWILRTEMGSGPLALLKLRGFTLPKEIFDTTPGDNPVISPVDDDDLTEDSCCND
ncbi:type VI secretion protein VasK [Photorhabdus sp. HUG-39]|uniref:Type VI secretion protein VasK n=2 Tax=Photorhabdus kayaii TaxID=230088 RepID=A0ABX0B813_9GAMM|nr:MULTISPECIES: ImcF-related family protein [Photorhabdus]MCC8374250.1 type VI secretion protein VasK [Photorhabdus bodei]NDL13370.1 type VI secretion protein VasK [Photorhabdus kayaii]NDL27104.1 type VI secretion protein VasK [Photorhabdus kayaii]RAX08046.1 type VI secretion protein VasK [Photorhabdus sp. HUG-39]